MTARLPTFMTAAALGALLGFGPPLAELWHSCRVPDSEACVWGKALLPVSLPVGGSIVALITLFSHELLRARQRRLSAPAAPDDGSGG